jgi:hypothetical protein
MATNTWVALDKVTVGSATPSVTFTSIPATYTDLVIIASSNNTVSDQSFDLQFNGEVTGTNYSSTYMYGTGSGSGNTGRIASDNAVGAVGRMGASSVFGVSEVHILNYANTATHKTVISRGSNADVMTIGAVGTWRASAAISTILITPESSGNINTGSTFSLYGILKEGTTPTPKATGGVIYSDSLYYYHAFGSTSVFTPSTSISADILVVAGGGAGGGSQGGGGGAGGLLGFASQSLTATNYTVTIGAGGTGVSANYNGVPGNNGSNSTFQGLTAAVGGGGGGTAGNSSVGVGSGGSGGGRANPSGAGTGTTGQGSAGGSTGTAGAKGGGGASAVGGLGLAGGAAGGTGATFNSTVGGTAGPYSFINAMGAATGTGEFSGGNYYYAGGGAGGCDVEPGGLGGGGLSTIPGRANTGGGGGGACGNPGAGGNGGSGLVIVRYLKA